MKKTAESIGAKFRGRAWSWLLGLMVLGGCMGTETTNPNEDDPRPLPGLSGTLVDGAGVPVEGATVKAFPEGKSTVDGAAGVAPDSVRTDAKGRYRIKELPEGSYNLIGEYGKRNLKVLIPRIPYQGPKISLNIGVDTLRAPGQIQGSVTSHGKPREGVFCYLPGTSYLSISDDNGGFWIANVPAGRYAVRYAQTGLATVADTGVVVRAGAITKLEPKEMSPDTAFPPTPPDSLWLRQDTAAGTVLVRWSRSASGDADGYWVYRNQAGADEPERVSARMVRDTFYVDTVFSGPADTVRRELVYRIKTQDTQIQLSVFSPTAAISAFPPFLLRPLVIWDMPAKVTRRDSIRIIVNFRVASGSIDSIQWDRDWNLPDAPPWRSKAIGAPEGADTLVMLADDVYPKRDNPFRQHSPILSLYDAQGRRWREYSSFDLVRDPPMAFAGHDTMVHINETFTLHGNGEDRQGPLVLYAWDMDGDGIFDSRSEVNGDITFSFKTPGRRTAVLWVGDNDGESDYDTLFIDVGSFLDIDTLQRDTVLKKSGNPWWIKRPMVVPRGRKLEMEAGTEVRFGQTGALWVYGTVKAKGAPGDSVRFLADGPFQFAPPNRQEGFVIVGSDAPNPDLDIASSLEYLSFRDARLVISNSRPRIEHSAFRDGYSEDGPWPPHLGFFSTGQYRGEWICRGNVFENFTIRLQADSLQNPPYMPSAPHNMIRFEGNRIVGQQGPIVVNRNRDGAAMEFIGNDVTVEAIPGLGRSGFSLEGGSPMRMSGNRVIGGDFGVVVGYKSIVEIDHNDFSGNGLAFKDFPEAGWPLNIGYSGRFHHNKISRSVIAAFEFAVHTAGRFDSNWVAGDAGKPLVKDAFVKGTGSADTGRDIDMRGNHWTIAGAVLDSAGVVGNMQVSEAARENELGAILLEPVLALPPEGAGRPLSD